MCRISTALLLRKLRRAGTLKNRFLTADAGAVGAGGGLLAGNAGSLPPAAGCRCRARAAWCGFPACATAAMLASASPRKPSVRMRNKSSVLRILLVAWRSRLMRASVGRHARAVVHHLHQLLAGLFHNELDLRGTSIDGIFQQLLHHRGGALHHLAGRNLVGEVFGEQVNNVGHRSSEKSKQPARRIFKKQARYSTQANQHEYSRETHFVITRKAFARVVNPQQAFSAYSSRLN